MIGPGVPNPDIGHSTLISVADKRTDRQERPAMAANEGTSNMMRFHNSLPAEAALKDKKAFALHCFSNYETQKWRSDSLSAFSRMTSAISAVTTSRPSTTTLEATCKNSYANVACECEKAATP